MLNTLLSEKELIRRVVEHLAAQKPLPPCKPKATIKKEIPVPCPKKSKSKKKSPAKPKKKGGK